VVSIASYWKLLTRDTEDVLSVGNEKSLIDLKMMYENKMGIKTKMVKCFGEDNYDKDWNDLKLRALEMLEHKC
jgi:hypothetical protein